MGLPWRFHGDFYGTPKVLPGAPVVFFRVLPWDGLQVLG